MTRREVFLQANPHVIYDRIGFMEIDWDGHIERFPFKRPFYICKGLNCFANGEPVSYTHLTLPTILLV